MNSLKELDQVELDLISGGCIKTMTSRVRKNFIVGLLMMEAAKDCMFGAVEAAIEPHSKNRIDFLLTNKSFLIGAFWGASLGGAGFGIVVGAVIGGLIGFRYGFARILPVGLR